MGAGPDRGEVLWGLLAPLGPFFFEVVFSMFFSIVFLVTLAPKMHPKWTKNARKIDLETHFDLGSVFSLIFDRLWFSNLSPEPQNY